MVLRGHLGFHVWQLTTRAVSVLSHKGLTSARHGRSMRYSKAVPGLGPGRRLVALSKDMKLPAVLLVSSTQSYQLNSQPPRGDTDSPSQSLEFQDRKVTIAQLRCAKAVGRSLVLRSFPGQCPEPEGQTFL